MMNNRITDYMEEEAINAIRGLPEEAVQRDPEQRAGYNDELDFYN
jgi:hypothetical protein